jgi:hypothetical protein
MANSIIYPSFFRDLAIGAIDLGNVLVLLTKDYRPNARHTRRSDVRGEIPAVEGNGYVAGGFVVFPTVGDDGEITLPGITIENATIACDGAIYATGAGNLICFIDFGHVVAAENSEWSLTDSTISLEGG